MSCAVSGWPSWNLMPCLILKAGIAISETSRYRPGELVGAAIQLQVEHNVVYQFKYVVGSTDRGAKLVLSGLPRSRCTAQAALGGRLAAGCGASELPTGARDPAAGVAGPAQAAAMSPRHTRTSRDRDLFPNIFLLLLGH
jgi:hypothetical protein